MISNLKDSEALMDFIIDTAKKEKVDKIEFLGDQFHTHAVVRVEVLDFWKKSFEKLSELEIPVLALVGNHDQPGSREKEQLMNSLNVLGNIPYVTIINSSRELDGIAYIPYMSDHDAFLQASAELYKNGATKLLVAHQTFTGATYDNGFYAEDGIEPALVHQEKIISGHIHKQQELGKCFYPGTPKWDTMSDANEDKGVWIYNHNDDGSVKDKTFISTKDVVTPIYKQVYEEGKEAPELIEGARNYLELKGKTSWITKVKKKYKGKANIKASPTDRRGVRVGSKDLISISEYVNKYFEVVDGVDKKDINEYLEALNAG